MLIFSFGTSFDLEDISPKNLAAVAQQVQYAQSKGIEVGGYDLICEDRGYGGYGGNVGLEWDVIDPDTGLPGPNACFASGWVDKLTDIVYTFVNATGLTMLETDGPYGGGPCASTRHDHHTDLSDSIYRQTQMQGLFYEKFRGLNNMFFNQPDSYFFQGGNKNPMGYNEDQFSLPRWQDISVSRQGMYDDTFTKIPTQGWMFVPLVDYHGGGDAAAFEPLYQNLADYEWALAQYMGAGVAACYRGYELYDTKETKAVVQKWVQFYKQYRDIIISDIIHVRRPDMQGIDCFMHVNPSLSNIALAMIFNPTDQYINESLRLPLYYSGRPKLVIVQEQGGRGTQMTVDQNYDITVQVNLAPRNITWFVISNTNSTSANR